MRNVLALVCGLALLSGLGAGAQGEGLLLLRFPTISKTQIAFNYAGDLWIVGRDGGDARRLTTGTGVETYPSFSPDGTMIAFTGEYDGNPDVYVIPATGGVPRRLTYHPGTDAVVGWTPDGTSVLFSTWANSFRHFEQQLYTVPVTGGFPTKLRLPISDRASFSADGTRLAYVPHGQWQAAWKRYRGGQTTPIWIAALSDSSITKIPRDNSNDSCPLWVCDTVYFLSDRTGPVSLFAFDTKTSQVSEALATDGFDFKSASAGPEAIVIEQFGAIKLYDLASRQAKTVPINVAADVDAVRPHFTKVDPKRFQNFGISPTGARAVFEAWGEIFTVPTDKGDIRNLTHSPAVADRDPSWSPDGKSLAYSPISRASTSWPYGIRMVCAKSAAFCSVRRRPSFTHPCGHRTARGLLFGQAVEAVVRRPRVTRACSDRRRLLRRVRALVIRSDVVARQQVDRVHAAAPQRTARRVPVLARLEEVVAGHRWHERCAVPALRQERQVSVLHRLHQHGACDGWPRHVE